MADRLIISIAQLIIYEASSWESLLGRDNRQFCHFTRAACKALAEGHGIRSTCWNSDVRTLIELNEELCNVGN